MRGIDHLEDIDQGYFEHFGDAMRLSWKSFKCAFKFFIHAFCPNVYKTGGSNGIMKLNETIRDKKIEIFNKKFLRSRQ